MTYIQLIRAHRDTMLTAHQRNNVITTSGFFGYIVDGNGDRFADGNGDLIANVSEVKAPGLIRASRDTLLTRKDRNA